MPAILIRTIDVREIERDTVIGPMTRSFMAHRIRSDNGPEFVAEAVQKWINAVSARTAFIKLGSPWENGYIESFNACFRDELLNGKSLYILKEAQIIIEQWRTQYNTKRPHSAIGYRPPAPKTIVPMDQRPAIN